MSHVDVRCGHPGRQIRHSDSQHHPTSPSHVANSVHDTNSLVSPRVRATRPWGTYVRCMHDGVRQTLWQGPRLTGHEGCLGEQTEETVTAGAEHVDAVPSPTSRP